MVQKTLAALAVALLVMVGQMSPVSAQSCEEFATQKEAQQQLEQAGDVEGLLDPDLNDVACEGVFDDEPAADENVISLSQDAPDDADEATGESGVTTQVSTDDGVEDAAAVEGEANAEVAPAATDDGAVAGDAAATDDSAVAGDAAATSDETGDVAVANDVVAVDDDDDSADPAPAPAPAPAPEADATGGAPVALPSTGVGSASEAAGAATALLLAVLFAGLSLVAGRRFQRG